MAKTLRRFKRVPELASSRFPNFPTVKCQRRRIQTVVEPVNLTDELTAAPAGWVFEWVGGCCQSEFILRKPIISSRSREQCCRESNQIWRCHALPYPTTPDRKSEAGTRPRQRARNRCEVRALACQAQASCKAREEIRMGKKNSIVSSGAAGSASSRNISFYYHQGSY